MGAMVRKQFSISPAQDRKLKALAARRGCSEADVLRDAVDRLPEPPDSGAEFLGRLAAAGLLAPKPDDPDIPTSKQEIEALEAEYEAWLATRPEGLGLAEALEADRNERGW